MGCTSLDALRKYRIASPIAAAVATVATTANIQAIRLARRAAGAAAVDRPWAVPKAATCDPASAIHFSSSARSLALCHLLSGSFARHFFTMRSSVGGVAGCTLEIGGGSLLMIAAINVAWLLPSNAFLPVTIS